MKTRLFLSVFVLALFSCSKVSESVLENEYVSFRFNPENGALVSLYGVGDNIEQ